MKIKFSVIIPLYNKEKYVLKTIESVFNQTHKDFEIVLIDDCSTDNSLNLVNQLDDDRIRIIKHEKNLGLSATRNTGIEAAKNDYIAFLDADDCWDANFLANINKLITKFPDQKVFATHYKENFNGTLFIPKIQIPSAKKGAFMLIDDFFAANMGRLILTQSCIVVNKHVFKEVGGYETEVTFAEDIDFFIRCFSMFSLAYYFKPLAVIRKQVQNSLTNSKTSTKKYPSLEMYQGQSKALDDFINFYLYCICRKKKDENDHKEMKQFRKTLNYKKLSTLKILLIHLPQPIYIMILWIKRVFLKIGLNLTSY